MTMVMNECLARMGGSYFGSGGYSAGWEVISGEIEATLITGSEQDNGFMTSVDYTLKPKTSRATVRLWCGDCLCRSGHRSLGPNGMVELVRAEVAQPPEG